VHGRLGPSAAFRLLDRRENVTFGGRFHNISFPLVEPVMVDTFLWNLTALRAPQDLRCRNPFCTQLTELQLLVPNGFQDALPQNQNRSRVPS
jgi:hypothetical protein